MSTFDSFADSPFQIFTEGQEITIRFTRTGPNAGRITWNIPVPAHGCNSDTLAYNGIVVTLDNTAITTLKTPVDGTYYTSDPTADRNLHAGDKIETSLVVGAFYDDKTTTSIDVTGLLPNTPYYISGFAVDAQCRYHSDGVHAYSLDYEGANETLDTSGSQVVRLGSYGVLPAASTGLNFGEPYDFLINIDGKDYPIEIDGGNAATYGDLVTAINNELGKLLNAPQGPVAPNTGTYFWNVTRNELFQWDGATHVPLDVVVETTDPTVLTSGRYWYNPTSGTLQRWDTPIAGIWNSTTVIKYAQDLTSLGCDDYWFSGVNAYQRDGNVWCEKTLWNQINDPTIPVLPVCGSYWYSEDEQVLYKWEDTDWAATSAIYWNTDPTLLPTGTFWFDLTAQSLSQRNGATWDSIIVTIGVEPTTPAPNVFWFDPSTEELWQRDAGNTAWNPLSVLVWEGDPTIQGSCDLWWNSSTDVLYVWDVTTLSWVAVVAFIQSVINPAAAPTVATDDLWYSPSSDTLNKWDGGEWVSVSFISFPTDPTSLVVDEVWMNPLTNMWNRWDGAVWQNFDPIDSTLDPSLLPTGTFWYDTTSVQLKQWNGSTWVALTYSTIPLTPTKGALWFDTTTTTLREWNGTSWIISPGLATTELNSDGNLLFTSTSSGSTSFITLVDGVLFSSLTPIGTILDPTPGSDGINPVPMYQQHGVGDDGTTDERRELMDSIRAQLGYPVVDVELTKYQLDTAVTSGIEALRKRSSSAYKRAFFFMDVRRGQQSYLLTNKTVGFNKIVTVMGLYRMTSAFLSTAYGNGVFGQVVLQQLYTMGTFDLLSYHLVAQYIEQLEDLFASRLMFQWNEHTRKLDILQSFSQTEKILVDATIERTEQELLTDRWTKTWIEKFALATARLMLGEIRGKYASLPGAGGGVALNASDLMSRADADILELLDQVDNYIVNNVEEYGMGTTFILG